MPNRILLIASVVVPTAAVAQECPLQHVTPPEPWWRAHFAWAVTMNEQHIIVSDPVDATLCPLTQSCINGAAHVYRLDPLEGWALRQKLLASDIDVRYAFGADLCLSGDRLIIGSPGSDLASPDAGAAYIFDFDGESWTETGQIAPVEPGPYGFGMAVALRGSAALVGEPELDLAWFYVEGPTAWTFRKKLEPPDDPPSNSYFGNALATDDDWVFIGARRDSSLRHLGGAVYIYRREPGGELTFTQKLIAPDIMTGPAGPAFGASIAVENDTLVVGGTNSHRELDGQGALYIYTLEGDRWTLRQEVTHEDPIRDDALGASLSLRGDIIVAGAPRQWSPTPRGGAFAFRRSASGEWRQAARLDPKTVTGPFGHSVATDGRWALVGSPDETVGPVEATGAAYIFDLACLLCRADLDGDGEVTFFDFLAFQNLFAAGDLRADFDGDGELTFFDFLAFQNEFAAGCD